MSQRLFQYSALKHKLIYFFRANLMMGHEMNNITQYAYLDLRFLLGEDTSSIGPTGNEHILFRIVEI